jgi:5,10-methylenetetrahydromethanopterin reductase
MARFGMMITCNRPPEELVGSAQYIESLGFDDVWLVEDLRWAGGIGPSAVVLASTKTVRVGLGILRNASATAMEVSALARLFPGRFAAGIGHGLQVWMSQIGAQVASPMKAIEEVTSVVRKMIRGGSVSFDGTYVKVDDIALVHPAIEVPPVLLGVTGPKSVELSGLDQPILKMHVRLLIEVALPLRLTNQIANRIINMHSSPRVQMPQLRRAEQRLNRPRFQTSMNWSCL